MLQSAIARRAVIASLLLAGCTQPPSAPVAEAPPSPSPPPPPPPVPFDQAVLNAGNAVFSAAGGDGRRQSVVIDPLVNGITGEQSVSTRALGSRLADLARQHYPQFDIKPFNASTVATAPLAMVGTFTPVNAQNKPTGLREAYRFCLVLADLKSGKIVAKNVVRALPGGVDGTPTRFFADSPAWTHDANIQSYINTCQTTKVGDPIPAIYTNGLIAASIVNEAIEAYDAGRFQQALDLYTHARMTPAGDQLRVYSGLYLSHAKLGRREQAESAFGDIVDYGIRNNHLAVKLLFRSASTAFVGEPAGNGTYDMWLRQIAEHAAKANSCLQVTGHTSASGSAVLNERLSVLRAEYVKSRLEQDAAALRGRVVAAGMGAQETLVGTGADDASDALDRRVEFKLIPGC